VLIQVPDNFSSRFSFTHSRLIKQDKARARRRRRRKMKRRREKDSHKNFPTHFFVLWASSFDREKKLWLNFKFNSSSSQMSVFMRKLTSFSTFSRFQMKIFHAKKWISQISYSILSKSWLHSARLFTFSHSLSLSPSRKSSSLSSFYFEKMQKLSSMRCWVVSWIWMENVYT
jgi:hypothetical protein